MANYLNEFIETIQGVPDEVQRNFCLIRDLDSTYTLHQRDLLKMHHEYLESLKRQAKDGSNIDPQKLIKSEQKLEQIRKLHKTTLQFADEKIAIANQSYDLVDEHIKRLDKKLRQFEAELTQSGHFNRAYATGGTGTDSTQGHGHGNAGDVSSTTEKKSSRKKDRSHKSQNEKSRSRKRKADQSSTASAAQSKKNLQASSAQVVTGFAPAEPLYCICKRPSFGKMVGCENEDCEISWYHFECVGLTEPPGENEKWYCQTCIAAGFGE